MAYNEKIVHYIRNLAVIFTFIFINKTFSKNLLTIKNERTSPITINYSYHKDPAAPTPVATVGSFPLEPKEEKILADLPRLSSITVEVPGILSAAAAAAQIASDNLVESKIGPATWKFRENANLTLIIKPHTFYRYTSEVIETTEKSIGSKLLADLFPQVAKAFEQAGDKDPVIMPHDIFGLTGMSSPWAHEEAYKRLKSEFEARKAQATSASDIQYYTDALNLVQAAYDTNVKGGIARGQFDQMVKDKLLRAPELY